jgi:hypothetical protein
LKTGWTIGRNVQLNVHWPGAEADDARRSAAKLVAVARTGWAATSRSRAPFLEDEQKQAKDAQSS